MPLYDYFCHKCGERHSVLKGIHDTKEEKCPDCNEEMDKVVSGFSVQYKGTGFHTTDYPSK